jgi:tape measure domain-containing protein
VSQDLRLTLRLNADGSGLRGELRNASGEVVKFGDQLEGGAKKGTKALKETEQQTSRLGDTTENLTRRVKALVAGYLTFQTAIKLGRMADEYTNLNAQIAIVTESAEQQAMVFERVEEIASRTGQSLSTVSQLTTRTIRALESSGESADEAIRKGLLLAEIVSDAVLASGASATEANAAMIQLAQGLASGELRGEEFRSVMEQTPRVAQALANALGLTIGQLRELAEQGELTTQVVTDALISQGEEIAREASSIPPTIARSWQALQNAVTAYVGEKDEGIGASREIAESLQAVAENLDTVVDAAELLALLIGGRLAGSLATWTLAQRAALAESIRYQAALASMAGLSRTAAASQLALAGATRAASGALALVGGPVGALVIGVGLLGSRMLSFRNELDELREPAGTAAELLERLQLIAEEPIEPGIDLAPFRSDIAELKQEINETERQLERLNQLRMDRISNPAPGVRGDVAAFVDPAGTGATAQQKALEESLATQREQLEAVQKEYDELAQKAAAAWAEMTPDEQQAESLRMMGETLDWMGGLADVLGDKASDAFGKWRQSVEDAGPANEKLIEPLEQQVTKLQQELFVLEEVAAGRQTAAMATLEFQEAQALAQATTRADREAIREKFETLRELTGEIDANRKATEAASRAEQQHKQRLDQLANTYGQLLAAANPLVAREQELNSQLQAMQELAGLTSQQLQTMGVSSDQVARIIEYLREQIDGLDSDPFANLSQEVQEILDWVDQMDMDPLIRDIQTLEEALADATDPEVVARLQDAIAQLRGELGGAGLDVAAMMAAYAQGTGQALRSIQQLTEVGSKEYQAIEVAIAAANLQAAIAAILNQGMGDPYTAPFRMAAMASAVAGLVGSIQGFGAGMDTTAQDRQDRQGTGSVLGDSEAKSESILSASETTAKAVSQLPGINRSMARNLQRLADGIAGASGMLARGAGDSEFAFGTDFAKYENAHNWGALGEVWDAVEFTLDPLGLFGGLFDWVGELFGGSSKVVDEGIAILGGTIGELIDETLVQAFQEVKYKKWVFGSSKRKTAFADLDDDISRQFQLIFESIADSVAAGAEALGLSADEIEAAIAQYEVEAQQISLKDLTAEEQQAELEAVFSKIFDGLAGQVVPFLPQFQQVGEGLADTLIRVATGVQVNEEAMRRFGWAVDQTDPERFAQISQGLIDLVGGLDPYMSGINSFFEAFAPAADKMEIAQSDLVRALEQVGLQLPTTSEGMWELMRSLDPATQAGREQIAMLIELTDTAKAYYSALDAIQNERLGLERQLLDLQGNTTALREIELQKLDESNRALQQRVWALQDEIDRQREIDDIMATARDDIASLSLDPLVNELRQLQVAHNELMKRADELGMSEQQLAVLRYRHQLQLQQLTAELEESVRSLWDEFQGGSSFGGGFSSDFTSSIDNAANQVRDSIIRALEGVQDWLNRADFEDPSLTPRARLQEMEEEFYRLIDVALTGSGQEQADAIAALPALASELRELGVQVHGSATEPYQDFLSGIVSAMEQVAGIDVPAAQDPVTGTQVGYIGSGVDSISQGQRDQTAIAAQIVEQIGALVDISGAQAPAIAERLGVNLSTIIEALIGEVQAGSIETVEQLIAVANTLGMDLAGVAEAIGMHVGALANQESLMSQAIEAAVLRMPPEIQEQLWGPLDRIWEATNEADANAAIDNLINATKGLPVEYKNALAPFFEEIDTQELQLAQIGILDQIRAISDESAAHLAVIAAALGGDTGQQTQPPPNSPIPDEPEVPPPMYAQGGWASGLIMTGDGGGPELVFPHEVSTFLQRVGLPVNINGMADTRVVEKLQQLVEAEGRAAEQRERLAEGQREATIHLATSMEDAAREARSMAGMNQ